MGITAVRLARAARIAGIEPQRFNEAVAAGVYPHAPPTTPGSARKFELLDILGLFIYAIELRRGTPQRLAGRLSEDLLTAVRRWPNEETLIRTENLVAPIAGKIWRSSDYPGLEALPTNKIEGMRTAWAVHIPVGAHLRFLERRLAEELALSEGGDADAEA